MKVLIVDDEPDVEVLFRQKFRKEVKTSELELEFAFSGEEAMEILQKTDPPNVVYVFSDINMPGMTGLELLAIIKSRFPEIKVSMISAYADTENHRKAMSSGAKEFFTKPIDFVSLKKELREIMSK